MPGQRFAFRMRDKIVGGWKHNRMAEQPRIRSLRGEQGLGIPIGFNIPFEVTYAGPAPYLVAGTSQINFQVSNVSGAAQVFVSVPSSSANARTLSFQVYIAAP
jgi:hypothetical protein